ncbi:MAG TPA: MoxR family ATPase [Pseudomonadales bacterium]|nr:MoxR family ATPase [Pseudomonadales bacterium]
MTELQTAHANLRQVEAEISKALIGQTTVIRHTLIALLAAGHVLIEGVPGLGKTLLVKALAKCFNGRFSRIQFTPDLMPADVTGHAIYNPKTEQFTIRKGPAFTHLLLADEINRAPAKTQSALLEVMQEKHITIEGKAFAAENPFMVLATQNPIEQEGTYPLPEAELDRFLLKILIDYPSAEEESRMVKSVTLGTPGDQLNVDQIASLLSPDDVLALQRITAALPVDDHVVDYAVRIVRATRHWPGFTQGAGPRGSLALIRAARAHALISGNSFVTPDDVKIMVMPALRHRVTLSAALDIEGVAVDQALAELLKTVEAPRD